MTEQPRAPTNQLVPNSGSTSLTAQSKSVADAIRSIGVTEVTYHRWKQEHGGLKTNHVRRLKELEQENARLRCAVSDLTLDKLILPEAAEGNRSAPLAGVRSLITSGEHCGSPSAARVQRSASIARLSARLQTGVKPKWHKQRPRFAKESETVLFNALMRVLAHILVLIFAVVTVSGHAAAGACVHLNSEHHHPQGDDMGDHDHAAGTIIPVAAKSDSSSSLQLCPQGQCDLPQDKQSGGHIHLPCCASVMALPPAEYDSRTFMADAASAPIFDSKLPLGNLCYPLLRPPSKLA